MSAFFEVKAVVGVAVAHAAARFKSTAGMAGAVR